MTAPTPAKIDADWLTEPARAKVFQALAAQGFPARAVGGAVRNAILDVPVEDVDLATPATPDEVMEAAHAAGLKVLPTGIAHGTVTIVVDGKPTEVTTLRRDVETHGRHATVAFTQDWVQDASRRDFTMNALYCDPDGTVHDPLGGYGDVLARRVRFIGDPATRIREDYLRILRFFRFNARYGQGPLDAAGLAACVAEHAGLSRLSGERIQQEMRRLIVAPRALEMTQALFECGLLTLVLGRAPNIARMGRLIEREGEVGAAPDVARRLAALAVAVTEDAPYLQERWKLANAIEQRLSGMATAPAWPRAPQAPEARALLYVRGLEGYQDAVLASWSRLEGPAGMHDWRNAYALPERWSAPRFPLGGDDAKAAGIAPGPAMGTALRAVEQAWIASDFTLDTAELRARLATLAASA